MKTTYLINSLEGGGAERVFSELIGMAAKDAELSNPIEVILLDIRPEAYRLPDTVRVHRLGKSAGFPSAIIQFLKVLYLFRELRPDRSVSFLSRANIINIISAKIFNFQSVVSERSNTLGRLSGKYSGMKRGLVALIYRRADKVIAVSNGVAECLIKEFGITPSKVSVLTNPVDFRHIQEQAYADNKSILAGESNHQGTGSIIAMGRLVDSKRFDDLIRAYAESGQTCGLTILGDGPNRQQLIRLIEELNLADQIQLKGFVGNPYAELARANFFILSSSLEGFPNALLEAMALGNAVISTDCNDGPREILALSQTIASGNVEVTEFGLMVGVGDCSAMAQAINCLANDERLRIRLAANARRRVMQFSKQEFYQKYTKLLEGISGAKANKVCHAGGQS